MFKNIEQWLNHADTDSSTIVTTPLQRPKTAQTIHSHQNLLQQRHKAINSSFKEME